MAENVLRLRRERSASAVEDPPMNLHPERRMMPADKNSKAVRSASPTSTPVISSPNKSLGYPRTTTPMSAMETPTTDRPPLNDAFNYGEENKVSQKGRMNRGGNAGVGNQISQDSRDYDMFLVGAGIFLGLLVAYLVRK